MSVFGQFCDFNDRVNSATEINVVQSTINEYLEGVLGREANGNNSVSDGGLGTNYYESPLGANDAKSMIDQIVKKIVYRRYYDSMIIGAAFNAKNDIITMKNKARATINFFSTICEITYTDNPTIKYFKILDFLLDNANNTGFLGPYGFIIDICRVYIDVTNKAISFIQGWLTHYLSDAYLMSGGGEIVIRIFINKEKSLTKQKLIDFIKVTDFRLESDDPNFPPVSLEAAYDFYSSLIHSNDHSIRVIIPAGNIVSEKRFVLKLKIGGATNVVYIPFNTNLFKREGSNFYLINLKKISGKLDVPKEIQFEITD